MTETNPYLAQSSEPTTKKRAIVMRGIPGSGKSTWLRINAPDARVFSADQYHTKPDGTYEYVPAKAGAAHRATLWEFMVAIMRGEPLVAVDNTNIKPWEYSPYIRCAEAAGYDVVVVECICHPTVALARGLHNIPKDVVMRMWDGKHELPPFVRTIQVVTGPKVPA